MCAINIGRVLGRIGAYSDVWGSSIFYLALAPWQGFGGISLGLAKPRFLYFFLRLLGWVQPDSWLTVPVCGENHVQECKLFLFPRLSKFLLHSAVLSTHLTVCARPALLDLFGFLAQHPFGICPVCLHMLVLFRRDLRHGVL